MLKGEDGADCVLMKAVNELINPEGAPVPQMQSRVRNRYLPVAVVM